MNTRITLAGILTTIGAYFVIITLIRQVTDTHIKDLSIYAFSGQPFFSTVAVFALSIGALFGVVAVIAFPKYLRIGQFLISYSLVVFAVAERIEFPLADPMEALCLSWASFLGAFLLIPGARVPSISKIELAVFLGPLYLVHAVLVLLAIMMNLLLWRYALDRPAEIVLLAFRFSLILVPIAVLVKQNIAMVRRWHLSLMCHYLTVLSSIYSVETFRMGI